MKRFQIVGLLLLGACGGNATERELSWVKGANADRMFKDSIAAGRIQFLAVCGYSCETPGLGYLTYAHCYQSAARVLTVDPTNDVIVSPEHGRLKEKAERIAQRYNARMIAWLDSAGRRTCAPAERWDDLWHAMIAVGTSVTGNPYAAWISALGEPGPRGENFQLHVPEQTDFNADVARRLCALGPQFGIAQSVRFLVTTGDVNNNPLRLPEFTCRNGKVAA